MVKVLYNGIDVFSTNGAPTPFVAISDQMVNYAQRWGVAKSITLNGMITGSACPSGGGYLSLLNSQSGIISAFSKDFQPLVIKDGNTVALSGSYIRVDSIDFDKAPYFSTLNFKVNLIYYPPELFTGTFGVTSPVSSIKYTEQPDRTVNISRSISAKGFNTSTTSNNALSNAISYVQSLTGTSNLVNPTFIPIFATSINTSGISLTNISPRKISEAVNRMDGTYSVNIDYSIRETSQTSTVLNYTSDINFDESKGVYTVSLKGNLRGTQSQKISDVRNEFNTYFKAYNLALYILNSTTGYGSLNPNPQSINISENEEENIVDFSYSYTTDPENVKFDYSVSLNEDYLSDKTSIEFNSTLTAKGPQGLRLAQLESYLANNFNIQSACHDYYVSNTTSNAFFNPIPQKYQIKRNLTSSNNSYSVSASFDNSPAPPPELAAIGCRSFNWSVSVTPSIYSYVPIQYLNGDNGLFDMNFWKRGKISLKGSAVFPDSADHSDAVRQQALNIFNKYAENFSIRSSNIDKITRQQLAEENGYTYTFDLSDTCETPIFTI